MAVEALFKPPLLKPPSKPGRPAHGRKLGVLLLEDEATARKSLARELQAEGFLVWRVSKGIDAIRRAGDPMIHIILLDIRMRGLYNGLEAARVIRETHPEKEILFVTAHYDEYHQQVKQFGLANVKWVPKPSTVQQLHDLLEAVRHAAREVEKRRARQVLEKAKTEGIGRRPLLQCLQQWDPQITDDMVKDLLAEGRPGLLAELLDELKEVRAVFGQRGHDFQMLQMAFGPFKKAVVDRLWDLYEHAEPHHRRIALQLELAVRKLSSLELEERHVDALEFVVRRLAQREVRREDVRDCKRILRYRGIDILLDLGQYREALLESYRQEDDDDDDQEKAG